MNCGCPISVFYFLAFCVLYTKRWKLGDRGRGKADSANRKRESGGITNRDGIGSDLDRIFQNPYPILNKNNISISISIYYG